MTNPIDVWFKFETDTCEEPTHEANTFKTAEGYRVEWYLNAVGQVTNVDFDTLEDAHAWYEREGFQDFSA